MAPAAPGWAYPPNSRRQNPRRDDQDTLHGCYAGMVYIGHEVAGSESLRPHPVNWLRDARRPEVEATKTN